jgi:hypothetical protein
MNDLKKQEQTAIEAVARRFSAKWESGSGPSDFYIRAAGKRIEIRIATLKRRGTGRGKSAKPGLRFDKVVIRLMERLQTTLGATVPDGMTVSFTVTAPIRLASKTAALLEDKMRTLVGRRSPGGKDTIHGNRVQIRLLKSKIEHAPKMIGFVHNPDSDALLLLDVTREMLELTSEADRRATRLAGDRWLVVTNAGGVSWLEAYRHICSQLHMAADFKKILMVFGDGRVEVLAG